MCLCDTGSARFSQDGMYFGEMVIEARIREDVILRQSFHAGL